VSLNLTAEAPGTVYAIAVERMTGKEQSLPPLSEQWPATDRTKAPNALVPD
jgi:uncharacterized protein